MTADSSDVQSTEFYEELVKAISEPEPMCLVLVGVEANDSLDLQARTTIAKAVRDRLARDLRRYDFLSEVEGFVFAVAMKTMADEADLLDRLGKLKTHLSEPYLFDDSIVSVQIDLGYAFRRPGESPASLLNRADESAAISRESGGIIRASSV